MPVGRMFAILQATDSPDRFRQAAGSNLRPSHRRSSHPACGKMVFSPLIPGRLFSSVSSDRKMRLIFVTRDGIPRRSGEDGGVWFGSPNPSAAAIRGRKGAIAVVAALAPEERETAAVIVSVSAGRVGMADLPLVVPSALRRTDAELPVMRLRP